MIENIALTNPYLWRSFVSRFTTHFSYTHVVSYSYHLNEKKEENLTDKENKTWKKYEYKRNV